MITEPQMADTPQNDLRASGGPAFDTNLLLGSIEFRVVRSGSAPRRMRINTTRCTLGSGEGCTVRLNDASLRPMHAVLLRDANRVLLRAYTVPIEVNGHLSGETFLHIGDRFVLGSYQFELVHSPDLTANLGANAPFFTERVESDNLGAAGIRDQPADSWSGEPRRTKLSAFPQEESEASGEARLAPPAKSKKRGRLSFLGGGGYVSEAIQSLAVSSHEPAEDSFAGSPRDHSDQLVLELTAYKKREQEWKAQDAQTRAELAEAIDRFHQSQERAKEASDAVDDMRRRMTQLSEEMESLANASLASRDQSDRIQEKYRQAAEIASDARSTAICERDEAQQATERALLAQQELTNEFDRLRAEQVKQREELTKQLHEQATQRDEFAKQLDAHVNQRESFVQRFDEQARQLNAQTQRGDELEAKHADLICQHEALQNSLEATIVQSRQTVNEFAQTQRKMDSLSKELTKATEKLHLAREEAAAAHVQINSLSSEVSKYQSQLATQHQSIAQTKIDHETLVDQLRGEVCRLEDECVVARKQIAAAANDKKLIESLQSQLSNSESRRSSDQSSWEQEAIQLQASIEQLSIDLAVATSRLSQTEGEYDATQTELNDAYDRLTTVRRELAARPTNEQWDDLQEQLVKTEHQLAETEKQLVTLRRDYDDLLACHSAKENAEAQRVPPAAFAAVSIPMEQVVHNAQSVEGLASNLISTQPEPQIEPQEENGDHGWPTYEAKPNLSRAEMPEGEPDRENLSEATSDEEPWDTFDDTVADRLASYTARDESRLPLPLISSEPAALATPSKSFVQSDPPATPVDSYSDAWNALPVQPIAEEPVLVAPEEAFFDAESDPIDESAAIDDSSIGSLAKQLIAKLNDSQSPVSHQDDTTSVSQSLGSWVNSSSLWQRVADPDESSPTRSDSQPFPPTSFASASDPYENFREEDSPWNRQESPADADHDSSLHDAAESVGMSDAADNLEQTCMLSQKPSHDYASFESSGSTVFPEKRPAWDEEDDDEDGRSGVQNEIPEYEPAPATENFRFLAESREPALGSTVPESEADEVVVDEDSIEAYMNRLLQRVQGHSSVGGERSPAAPTAIETKSKKTNRLTPDSDSRRIGVDTAVVTKTVEVIDPNTPLVPRSQAPEDAGNLAAMRELANASAHSAISISARGQAEKMKSRAIMDLLQAGVIMICGFAFYTCGLKISSLKYVWFTASALAILLAFFFLFDMVKKLAAAKMTYEGFGDRHPIDGETKV